MAGTETSFVELDVLEFGAHHAADDDLHLLRDTENQCTEEIRERTELRRVFCTERGLAMCWSPVNKGKARLVALRSIQRIVCRRGVLPDVRAGSEATRSESSGALPYLLKWNTLLLGTLLFWFRFTLCTTSFWSPRRWHPRVRTGTDWACDHLDAVPLILWRSRLHFCCYANSIPVSSSPSALPVLPLLPG